MKHSYFSNYFIICLPSFFSIIIVIIELFVVYCLRIIFVLVIQTTLTLYMYLFIEIPIYTCIPFIYLYRYASKNYSFSI